MDVIKVSNLTKDYTITKKNVKDKKGSPFKSQKEYIRAVDNINLNIAEGSCVGFMGPNGAGKSTTIKMLTGILKPTSGEIRINGLEPWKQRKEYVKNIGVVFGNRSQLWWDLPVIETFELLKEIYNIPKEDYTVNVNKFIELLDLQEIMNRPVRQLSLGQRMRCEIAASFLHNPKLVFLDEPTIGLDLVAKDKIRNFISTLNKEKKVTILITSHDISDIESMCEDLIIIDHGKIIFENQVKDIVDIFGKRRFIDIEFKNNIVIEDERIEVLQQSDHRAKVAIDLDIISIGEMLNLILSQTEINDIKIFSTPVEEIVKTLYSKKF